MIRLNIGMNTFWDERDGMIMESMGRGEFFGDGKNNLVAREDRLEVGMHRRCLNNMNGVKLGCNSQMTLLRRFSMQWELMILGEPVVIPWNL